jgi:cellulose synthase/poly-beta-1,6-N-acetylglucosamine synthase-like glycosyltransferase
MNYALDVVMIPAQLIIAFFTVYYFIIAVFGMWHRKEKNLAPPKSRFAIVIPAHNESMVLGDLLDNLKILKYPHELYDIYVIADNCTDNTAEIARQHGANVLVRFNKEQVGKGYAMDWAFPQIFALNKNYDAFCVFDADNLVHLDFLSVMNNRLLKGQKIMQGYLSAKNPSDTWVSGTFAIAFWTINHLWHLGKYNIGLSTALGGTGMCIAADVIKTYGWGCDCLTEDMEFSVKCLTHGIRTCWVHDAIVYDEKPLTFMASWRQRKRWAQGQFDCAGRYIPRLIHSAFAHHSLMILDGVMQLLQNYFLLFSTWFAVMTYINMFYPCFTMILYNDVLVPRTFWTVIGFIQYVMPLIVLLQIKVPKKIWLYWIVYPVFMYSWIPVTFLGFLDRHKKGWVHTIHTRSMQFKDASLTRKKELDR